jgi:N-glycosylase/DNA lyase
MKNSKIKHLINKRLNEFNILRDKTNEDWFSELCFCILTANSKAESAIKIQNQIGLKGFLIDSEENIARVIKLNKHRFYNNKSQFICEARKNNNIKDIIQKMNEFEAREWLVKNIKGVGYKEASHFLRNVGYKNLAILDRHILNLMVENKLITEKPKSLNKKIYLDVEKNFNKLAEKLGMSSAELDLYMWYLKTGKVLK